MDTTETRTHALVSQTNSQTLCIIKTVKQKNIIFEDLRLQVYPSLRERNRGHLPKTLPRKSDLTRVN